MHILIVSATQFEVAPLLQYLGIDAGGPGLYAAGRHDGGHTVEVLITGIGMVNTARMMGRYALRDIDLAINAGVCGAFDKNLDLGQVVHVVSDILSEMGAEDGDAFLRYDELGLPGKHLFDARIMPSVAAGLPPVKGITVNTVHGNDASIGRVKQLYQPDVESMEGAAFFASCEQIATFMQIRSVSNYVEKRDKSKWQMPLAIKNLNDWLIRSLASLPDTGLLN